MEKAKSKMLVTKVVVDAPLRKVWESFTEPEHIKGWCFASDDWHAPFSSNDLRKGGKLVTTMAAKDGSMSFDVEGTYDEVLPLKKLHYTMTDGREVDVQFVQKEGGVEVIQEFEPEKTNPLDMQQSGWQAILDNFKKYTEK